jgi:type VI secretion system secreted protein Hcp
VAVDAFLKLDGIKGESTDDKHKDEIDVLSWSWGLTQSGSFGTGGGAGAGKVQFQDFHFTSKISKASPNLFMSCASGQHIKEATITARKAGERQQDFLIIKMNDVLVTSYQTAGSGQSEALPTDQFSLNFAKIEYTYVPQKPDGSAGDDVNGGWDLKLNKKA